MKLGTVVYNNKIYNLDYMSSEEVQELLKKIEAEKKESITEVKKLLKK
jgi:hypothetical protein